MGKFLNTLTARMILIGLAMHAVLMPIMFYGLFYIVKQTHEERFVNDVRKYSRFLADFIESEGVTDNKIKLIYLLDSAILGSGGVYAELIDGETRIQSALQLASETTYKEDFAFGEHDDNVYFLSIPLQIHDRQVVLRMGYDELPTIDQLESARQRIFIVLFCYLVLSIMTIVLLSARMTRPLKALQNASRNIAKGRYSDQLHVDSNLTEIRELASDLESMRSELVGMNASLQQEITEKEAADKLREVLESKLRQSQKLETVGVMAGGIAHEFNNILVPIFLYTEQALLDLSPDNPVRQQLERVLKSANRAKSVIQQILTFSRQPGKQEYTEVDVSPVIEEALELLRALIPSTVELQYVSPAEKCMVMADRNQIHQLVMNLCSNAYQAIEDGDGTITVTLDCFIVGEHSFRDRRLLKAGRYARMIVQDTGHGMSRSKLERIFEPFYTTRAVGKGTGLGLSVAHGIAVSHNGDITVESVPEKGTTFRVYLPIIEQTS